MNEALRRLSSQHRELIEEVEQPRSCDAMLATLHDEPFSDEGWLYERKLDGVRALVFRKGGEVELRSRNDKSLAASYPELVDALSSKAAPDVIVDGEIVAFRGRVTSFSRLQGRMKIADPQKARASGIAVYLYLFDIIHLEGYALEALPLRERKKILRAAIEWNDPIRFTPHRNGDGISYHREACRKGWEGVIAKDAASTYVHGRSRKWLKLKCVHQQELVVGGWEEGRGKRAKLGALLVGFYEDGELKYAGKVGTGYDEETIEELVALLEARERKTPPFDADDLPRDARWAAPELVAEVGFTEWTQEHRLRHPRFLGLRDDKDPREVVREVPK